MKFLLGFIVSLEKTNFFQEKQRGRDDSIWHGKNIYYFNTLSYFSKNFHWKK
jgi:hypothetical protein